MKTKQSPSVLKISNFKKEDDKRSDVYIRTFQKHKVEHPFIMDAHAHDFYLVMLFTKGTGSHTIDFKKYPVSIGSVFFMSPSQVHSWQLTEDTDGYVLFFNSSFYLMDALSKQLFNLPFLRPQNKISYAQLNKGDQKKIENVFESMTMEAETESKFKNTILRSYLDVLLFKLADMINSEGEEKTKHVSIVPELERLIDKHFTEHQTLSFYSEKLNVSPQQLNSITKKYLNKTVAELIQARMIAEAKRLLVYSSLTVSEIGYRLNFNDNSYFNRFFKKVEKITPEQFRNQF
jgi:AraC family transcriptional regulator, transcriptional activator of pobA